MDELISTKELRKRQIKKALIVFFVIALIFSSYIYFYTLNRLTIKVNLNEVSIHTVIKDSLNETLIVDTKVEPKKVFFLDLSTGGKVKEIFVTEGQRVKKGQKLVELENNTLKLSIISRESQITEQINNLRNTRIALEKEKLDVLREKVELKYQIKKLEYKLDKEKKMLDKAVISRDQYRQTLDEFEYYLERDDLLVTRLERDDELRKNQQSQIETGITSLTENLNFSKKLLDQLIIRSPIDGMITSLQTELGEYISEGSRIGQVDIEGEIKLVARIDEFYLSDINIGMVATNIIDDKSYKLKVSRINSEIIEGKFEVIFNFQGDTPSKLKRGQSFPINLNLKFTDNSIIITNDAIYSSFEGKWVFLFDQDTSIASKKLIKIGRITNQYTEVEDDLSEGDKVIYSNVNDLSNFKTLIIENKKND